jgi:hypothetical protein
MSPKLIQAAKEVVQGLQHMREILPACDDNSLLTVAKALQVSNSENYEMYQKEVSPLEEDLKVTPGRAIPRPSRKQSPSSCVSSEDQAGRGRSSRP